MPPDSTCYGDEGSRDNTCLDQPPIYGSRDFKCLDSHKIKVRESDLPNPRTFGPFGARLSNMRSTSLIRAARGDVPKFLVLKALDRQVVAARMHSGNLYLFGQSLRSCHRSNPSCIICYIWRPFARREMGSRDQGIREMGKRGKSCRMGGEMANCCNGRCDRGEM